MPELFSAKNVVSARPLRVCASIGSTRPSVALNRTVVPFCTGVPACSMTNAVTSVFPPLGSTLAAAATVIVDFVGASNCALSQATVKTAAITSGAPTRQPRPDTTHEREALPLNIVITKLPATRLRTTNYQLPTTDYQLAYGVPSNAMRSEPLLTS